MKILKDPKISRSDKERIEVYLKAYPLYYISDPDGYTNVREGKSTSSKILGTVKSGEKIEVLDTTGDWWQVMTRDNEIGYIHKSRIKRDKIPHLIQESYSIKYEEITKQMVLLYISVAM